MGGSKFENAWIALSIDNCSVLKTHYCTINNCGHHLILGETSSAEVYGDSVTFKEVNDVNNFRCCVTLFQATTLTVVYTAIKGIGPGQACFNFLNKEPSTFNAHVWANKDNSDAASLKEWMRVAGSKISVKAYPTVNPVGS